MSLRGRYFIDRIKRVVSGSLRLPVPPYGDPFYWDASYRSFGPQDSFEWGSISYEDLAIYNYHQLDLTNIESDKGSSSQRMIDSPEYTTTLARTLLGVDSDSNNIHENVKQQKQEEEEPILILGCGNSRFGEEMIEDGWKTPIIQTDVSGRVIEAMSHRCNDYIASNRMSFVEDDATELSAFRNDLITGVFDKGLIDAIYCSDDFNQCGAILSSVNRILQPGGNFVFLSFSRPEFLLPNIVKTEFYKTKRPIWDNVEVQELSSILLYRFQKQTTTTIAKKLNPSRMKKIKKQQQRRRR